MSQTVNETGAPIKAHIDAHMANLQRLPMWTVYRPTTSDHPGVWLARMWLSLPVNEPTDLLIKGRSLEEVRAALPPGLTKLGRQPNDDPVIEEMWL